MGGFSNAVLGGATKLIRAAIQSPNFLSGVSGWTINRDGSVEFNSGTFRGIITNGGMFIYDGTPAAGKLMLAVSPTAGVDAFGNAYQKGFNTYLNVIGPTFFNFLDQTTQALLAAIGSIAGTFVFTTEPGENFTIGAGTGADLALSGNDINITGSGASGQITIGSDNQLTLQSTNVGFLLTSILGSGQVSSRTDLTLESAIGACIISFLAGSTGLKIGAGPTGKYYQERVTADITQSFVSATATILTNMQASQLRSDYGSAFNLATGTWTCPQDGPYRHFFGVEFNTWLGGSRLRITMLKNGAFWTEDDISQLGATGRKTLFVEDNFIAGDTVNYQLDQLTGANRVLTNKSFIHVARTL